jgi:hypothetical protein
MAMASTWSNSTTQPPMSPITPPRRARVGPEPPSGGGILVDHDAKSIACAKPATRSRETSMPDQPSNKTQRARDAGAEAARQGAERLQSQMDTMLGTTSRVSQEVARQTSENLELMKRLAETMLAGAREASSEVVEWTRQAAERQAEATRQITQARSPDEMLELQNRYIRDNLQALLDLSARVSRLSADKASEASGHLDQSGR